MRHRPPLVQASGRPRGVSWDPALAQHSTVWLSLVRGGDGSRSCAGTSSWQAVSGSEIPFPALRMTQVLTLIKQRVAACSRIKSPLFKVHWFRQVQGNRTQAENRRRLVVMKGRKSHAGLWQLFYAIQYVAIPHALRSPEPAKNTGRGVLMHGAHSFDIMTGIEADVRFALCDDVGIKLRRPVLRKSVRACIDSKKSEGGAL